jgi:hypothetical protein
MENAPGSAVKIDVAQQAPPVPVLAVVAQKGKTVTVSVTPDPATVDPVKSLEVFYAKTDISGQTADALRAATTLFASGPPGVNLDITVPDYGEWFLLPFVVT